MVRKLFTVIVALIPLMKAAGDIAPFPVQAKGIIPEGGIEIRMVRERVVVDLYRDSSVVECLFVLKNDGKAMMVNIGFPEMNFYHSRTVVGKVPENFFVFENDKPVAMVEAYRPSKPGTVAGPDKTGNPLSNEFFFSPAGSSDDKPWLLWDSQFEENEIKIVTVRYTLPYGVLKSNYSRYFTYLLSTGAGWKGNIEYAEIVVNLKDVDYEMVLQASPAGYSVNQNQMKWIMTDLNPTTDDDIYIYYEPVKGDYEKWLALNPPAAWFIDGELVWNTGVFNDRSLNPFIKMAAEDILLISILKDSPKEVYGYESVVKVTTKNFAIDRFVTRVLSENPEIKSIQSLPHPDFIEKYHIEIDGVHFEGENVLRKLPQLELSEIEEVRSKKAKSGKVTILIKTKM